jgi:hypothetical protein
MAIGFMTALATAALAQTAPTASAPAVPASVPATMVYVPQLPSATELVKAAAAQGMAVDKIEQSANQVVAVYKLSNGQEYTVVYQPLPPEEAAAPATAATTTTVAYAAPYGYAYYPGYYYPGYYWPYYPPVAIGLGFGWGWYGGWHGGYGGFRGGGGRR